MGTHSLPKAAYFPNSVGLPPASRTACLEAPKVSRLAETRSFGRENADAFKLSPHLISICK